MTDGFKVFQSEGWRQERSVSEPAARLSRMSDKKNLKESILQAFKMPIRSIASAIRVLLEATYRPASVAGSSSASIFSAKVLPSELFISPAFLKPSRILALASSGLLLR